MAHLIEHIDRLLVLSIVGSDKIFQHKWLRYDIIIRLRHIRLLEQPKDESEDIRDHHQLLFVSQIHFVI